MLHFFHPTFLNAGYELQMKWEVNCGATFRFPDISSRFAKCNTYLDPHFNMVHFFHPTFPNGGSYMFTLNASKDSSRLPIKAAGEVSTLLLIPSRACHKSKISLNFFGTRIFSWVCLYINGKFWFWRIFFIFRWVKMPLEGYKRKKYKSLISWFLFIFD